MTADPSVSPDPGFWSRVEEARPRRRCFYRDVNRDANEQAADHSRQINDDYWMNGGIGEQP